MFFRELIERREQSHLALVAREDLAGRRHAGDQQIDQAGPAGVGSTGVQRYFSPGVAFLTAEEAAVGVDDSAFSHLAKPIEWVALLEIDFTQRPHGLGT